MDAGFAEVKITPDYYPIRTYMGQVKGALDDIFARAAVFRDGSDAAALLSLDVVMLEWEHVKLIREGAARSAGLPPDSVTVACTHNHACPAVIERGSFKREDRYIESLVKKSVEALVKAASRVERAETGAGYGFEGRISFNRRFIMKDKTVITQPPPDRLDEVLANEGVIDPGVGVLCARRPDGKITGAVVNFASHAVHHMGKISAGYPGVLSRRIKEMFGDDCVCLFLNGACGNIHNVNYADPGRGIVPKEECGGALAEAAGRVIGKIKFKSGGGVNVKERGVKLGYRGCSKLEELVKHPEQFVNVFPNLIREGWYKWSLEKLRNLHAEGEPAQAVLQVIKIGDAVICTVPGEYFTEYGLRIKESCAPEMVMVATLANGWLGYIPLRESFARQGGHETTTAWWSKMEPEAGDIIADRLIAMVKE